MKIEKSFTVAAPRVAVCQFITSPEAVAACVPGCEKVEQTGESTYQAVIRIKIGMIKARFNKEI
ncbi:MAG: SRPBCC domain-containing protein [Gammaproteobacteria bacterium]|nr:SRPBCC domain-containing protein [Gammaproteobacteria bacterium]